MKLSKKSVLAIGISFFLIGTIFMVLLILPKKKELLNNEDNNTIEQKTEIPTEKVDIIDLESNIRPYAVVINNTPVAVKVQEGLKEAYLIYEFPTEGNTSRLMALYKTEKDVTVGTIRSVRHNFIDYAHENDAVMVGFGWSHYAKDELQTNKINYINGIVHSGPFWRDNKENLAVEHTVYTTLNKLKEYGHQYKQTTEVKPPFMINASDIDLSSQNGVKSATEIILNYGPSNKEHFIYDEENKIYLRNFNDTPSLDHETKKQVSAKNIIITEITYQMCSDNHYWDLHDTGSGTGYFITNGKAVPIQWQKESRNAQTKYTYIDGTPVEVSDGNTWIALFIKGKEITIS